MARRFFYISLGILALSAAYHMGAGSALADFDDGVPGRVIGVAGGVVFRSDGVGTGPTALVGFGPKTGWQRRSVDRNR